MSFGCVDAFEYLESQKEWDVIIFGIGTQHQDVITTLLLNQKPAIIIAPVFESETQQSLSVFCHKDSVEAIKQALQAVTLLTGSITSHEVNDDIALLRLMPCYFSPILSKPSETLDDSGINFAALGLLSGPTSAKKAKKFKHMDHNELLDSLSEREVKFKEFFLAQKRDNPNFSLKDIKSEEMLTILKEIGDIKRIQKAKQASDKVSKL